MYLLGFDIGSSSIKAALVDAHTNKIVAATQVPDVEMDISAPQQGWAEQDPNLWWQLICAASQKILAQSAVSPSDIAGIGIAYQMHGLVLVDKAGEVLRPSIIWCDSRAVEIGNQAFKSIGVKKSLSHLLNSPGNFTASKLRWVQQNEPEIYEKVHHFMLPGDFIAMKMTGDTRTTISGLSEGIFWDFKNNTISKDILKTYQIDKSLVPELCDTFGNQGELSAMAATEMGLVKGIKITYRAGDQPNNALSLNALQSGEVAATGGTSGVVYGVTHQVKYDPKSRVNSFAHVNHTTEETRIGVLLCINGAGRQYAWLRHQLLNKQLDYNELEHLAKRSPIGSKGLEIYPYGNGAERLFENKNIGAHFQHLDFNRHQTEDIIRATLEGIAYTFIYGMKIMQDMGLNLQVMRVGNDNLFQSKIFSQTISSVLNTSIEMLEANGAAGAARAAGVGVGLYKTPSEAMQTLEKVATISPDVQDAQHKESYEHWAKGLDKLLKN
jgi:xylulokinase